MSTTFPPYEGMNENHNGGHDTFGSSENRGSYGRNENHYHQDTKSNQGGDNRHSDGYGSGNNSGVSIGGGSGQGGGNGSGNWNNGNMWNNDRSGGGNTGNRGNWGGNGGGGNRGGWNGNRGNFKPKGEEDLSLYKPYAFAANADIPPVAMGKIIDAVRKLETLGYTLRVGGMEGPEEQVENAVTKKEVHLPFKGYNNKESKFTWANERAYAVAKMYHPAFDSMKKGVQCFLAKNARIILGNKMDSPALFLIAWTEDGAESSREKGIKTGFTGHPIAIAAGLGVPIFNFGKEGTPERFDRYLDSIRPT